MVLCKFREENQIVRLETFLRAHLTDYFLPNLIVPIQRNLPLNLNGKIDRTSLASLYSNNTITNDLTRIWQVKKSFDQHSFVSCLIVESPRENAENIGKFSIRRRKFLVNLDIDRTNQTISPISEYR